MNSVKAQRHPLFGAHLFLWASGVSLEEHEQAISAAASLGLDFVQVPVSASMDPSALKRILATHSMGCFGSAAIPQAVWSKRSHATLSEYMLRAIDYCAAIECPLIAGALYTPMGERGGVANRSGELRLLRACLKEAAQYGRERGVALALEPLNRYETSLLNTCESVLEFIDQIDEPDVLVHLDTFHANIEEQDIYRAFVCAGDKLGFVHICESDRGVPGDGNVPWDAVFAALRDIEYRGPLGLESFFVTNRLVAETACIWRDFVGDADRYVTRARRQMREAARSQGYDF